MSQAVNYTELAERYIAVWNEQDPERRLTLMEQTFTETAHYQDPLMAGCGHAEIDNLIRGVQTQFPGHTLRLAGVADGFGNRMRCSWELVPENGVALVKATDFMIILSGRLADVTGFIDQAPT